MEPSKPPIESETTPTVRRRSVRSCSVIAVGIFLLVGSLGVGIVWGYLRCQAVKLKSSEPYQAAIAMVRENPEVIERLGEPIDDVTRMPSGQLNLDGDRGDASLHFNVAGPNGNAVVHTQGRRIEGEWGLTTLEVTFDDGKRIVLDTITDEAGSNMAPRWAPPDETRELPPGDPGESNAHQPPEGATPSEASDASGKMPAEIQLDIPSVPGPQINLDLPNTPNLPAQPNK